ncbi:unnamed protein product, partial [Urochloa humidicola]
WHLLCYQNILSVHPNIQSSNVEVTNVPEYEILIIASVRFFLLGREF